MRNHVSSFARYVKGQLEDAGVDSRLKYNTDPVGKIVDNFVWIRILFSQCGEVGQRYTIGEYITVETEASFIATFFYKEKNYQVGDKVREIVLGGLGRKIGDDDYYYAEDGFFQVSSEMWGTDVLSLSKVIIAKWTNKIPRVSEPLAQGIDLYQVILGNKD